MRTRLSLLLSLSLGLVISLVATATLAAPSAAGAACAADSECATGICAQNVCCNSRCDGKCQACNFAASMGACSSVSADAGGVACGAGMTVCTSDGRHVIGLDGTVVSCAPYKCDPTGPLCLTLCVRPSDCADGYQCDVPSRSCVPVSSAPDSGAAAEAGPRVDEINGRGCSCEVGVGGGSRADAAGVLFFVAAWVMARRHRQPHETNGHSSSMG